MRVHDNVRHNLRCNRLNKYGFYITRALNKRSYYKGLRFTSIEILSLWIRNHSNRWPPRCLPPILAHVNLSYCLVRIIWEVIRSSRIKFHILYLRSLYFTSLFSMKKLGFINLLHIYKKKFKHYYFYIRTNIIKNIHSQYYE